MSISRLVSFCAIAFTPLFVFAAPESFSDLVDIVLRYIGLIVPLFITLTFLVFFWGLARFILRVGGNEQEIENGKNLMLYGIIGLFVMVSIWAIVSFLQGEFNFGSLFIPQLPENQFQGTD